MSTASRLVHEAVNQGGRLRVEGGTIKLTAREPLADSLVSELRENKPAIIKYLTGGRCGLPENIAPPSEWVEGVSSLANMDAPGDWPEVKWPGTVRGAGSFLKAWGGTAHALGWTTLDCFGVHLIAPFVNIRGRGLALSMFAGDVALLLPDKAVIRRANGARLTAPRWPTPPGTVPIWELGAAP